MIWVRVYGEGGTVNKAALHLTLKLAALTHTHTHKRNRMPDEKNIYLKHVHILQPQIRKSWDSMENANKKRK